MSDSLPPLRKVVEDHGLWARRSLGQNFLFDLNLTGRIARAAGPLEDICVVEIGPGPGGLTRALLANGVRRVLAIECDPRCMAPLREIAGAYPDRLEIVMGDALELDLHALLTERHISRCRIVANLPYHIGTKLLTQWLSVAPWPPFYDRLILMFQREVAERIVATPAQPKDYGRLSVLCGWRTKARILFDIPPEAFTPRPKITSSVVELIPLENPWPCALPRLCAITQAAFSQRRKMLRQSLKGLGGQHVCDWMEACGISPTSRAEELEVADFVHLAQTSLNVFDPHPTSGS